MAALYTAPIVRVYNCIKLMPLSEDRHHRRSIRIAGYDYSQAGAYFVTIVSHNRENLFGIIHDGEMIPNLFGEIVDTEWLKTSGVRTNVELGEYIIMPNHVHGIIIIRPKNTSVGAIPP